MNARGFGAGLRIHRKLSLCSKLVFKVTQHEKQD